MSLLARRLRTILQEQAVLRGDGIRLASGRTSSLYFDVKRPMFEPEAASLIAAAVLDLLAEEPPDAIGGMAMGAVPLISAVCALSWPRRPIPGFFVRKDLKEHGTQQRIEGCFEAGMRAVLLEDVVTTGGSTLTAAEAVREGGGIVNRAIAVIDRLEGGSEKLRSAGITLEPLFTRDDFVTGS